MEDQLTDLGEDCPECNSTDLKKPRWTWWGGVIGPRLMNHTVCRNCGFGFNAKTRKSNKTTISLYIGISLLAGALIVLLMRRNF
jgi:hypothetical protein